MPKHAAELSKQDREQAKPIIQVLCVGGMVLCAVLKGSDVPWIVYASLAAGFLGTTRVGDLLDKLIKLRGGK